MEDYAKLDKYLEEHAGEAEERCVGAVVLAVRTPSKHHQLTPFVLAVSLCLRPMVMDSESLRTVEVRRPVYEADDSNDIMPRDTTELLTVRGFFRFFAASTNMTHFLIAQPIIGLLSHSLRGNSSCRLSLFYTCRSYTKTGLDVRSHQEHHCRWFPSLDRATDTAYFPGLPSRGLSH